MKQTILINKYIIQLLRESNDLTAYVADRIYPIDAKQGTVFPFIVVKRNNIIPQYCKDGNYLDIATVQVIVVAQNYIDSVNIAQLVRQALELKRGKLDADFTIRNIMLNSVSEDLYNNVFIQQLNFDVQV